MRAGIARVLSAGNRALSAHFLLPVRAIRTPAIPVHDQRMITNREPEALRNRCLPLLDTRVHELFDPATVQTHNVIVVSTVVQLKDGHAILEVMTGNEPGRLKLRQYAVDGGQPDIFVTVQERAVNVFGRQVSRRAALEDF